jgi:hypothetical protein
MLSDKTINFSLMSQSSLRFTMIVSGNDLYHVLNFSNMVDNPMYHLHPRELPALVSPDSQICIEIFQNICSTEQVEINMAEISICNLKISKSHIISPVIIWTP